jgi:hypothetical protein
MSSWAKEMTDWMLTDHVKKRPTAKECRESVWVRQGERISPGVLRILRQGWGIQSTEIDDEMDM